MNPLFLLLAVVMLFAAGQQVLRPYVGNVAAERRSGYWYAAGALVALVFAFVS